VNAGLVFCQPATWYLSKISGLSRVLADDVVATTTPARPGRAG
jgi:hypothetical protein